MGLARLLARHTCRAAQEAGVRRLVLVRLQARRFAGPEELRAEDAFGSPVAAVDLGVLGF
jgi:hypothetical protein